MECGPSSISPDCPGLRNGSQQWAYTTDIGVQPEWPHTDSPARNVVNPADPNELGQLPTATTGLVDAIAFSQQGILASVDGDGAIQLWTAADPAHPRPFGQPIAGSSAIISVAFSPDGTMASGTSTGTIVLWDLHVSDAIKRICTTAGGNLTPQNWHNYISQLPYQSPCGP